MAPLLRLANECAWAADADHRAKYLSDALNNFHRVLVQGSEGIAREFASALRKMGKRSFLTYSYSSTVVKALRRARSRVTIVYCSESRPGREGRRTARELSKAGIPIVFSTDAQLFESGAHGILVLGADKVLFDGFENKVGTRVLVENIRQLPRAMRSVWVLADTTKFWPERLDPSRRKFWKPEKQPLQEIWKNAPRSVSVSNVSFGRTPCHPWMRVLTEKGWMTPKQVRRELQHIRISPRLTRLAD
jgi:translation initiation factor 2B subunit (eIF-2B alpha/beta/delta family)